MRLSPAATVDTCAPPAVSLRPSRTQGRPSLGTTSASRTGPSTEDDAVIRCRQCRHPITSPGARFSIDGAHVHTFANPEGIVFEIGCYQSVWGCVYVGPASREFTWFRGYVWRIALCAACRVHIGWRFSAADGAAFHGLITSRLLFPGDRP